MRRYGALISDLSICDIKFASVGFSSSRSYDGGRSGALLVSDARQEEDGECSSYCLCAPALSFARVALQATSSYPTSVPQQRNLFSAIVLKITNPLNTSHPRVCLPRSPGFAVLDHHLLTEGAPSALVQIGHD